MKLNPYECPWSHYACYNPISINGCKTSSISETDVESVIGHDAGSDFQASEIAIVRLKDGRFVGWESWSDVTGSGFNPDAYGGDVEVWFANSLAELKPMFSKQAWQSMNIA